MSDPTPGWETRFQYGNSPTASGSTSWTDFSQIVDLKPPKIEAKDIDVSVMDSPDQFEVYFPGWASGGEASVKIQFSKAQQASLYGIFRQPKGFRVMFNDGTTEDTGSTLAFSGYLKSLQNETPRLDVTEAEITVKVNGKPVFTPGT